MNNIAKWNVNESLLQSYRSIFISSQAFMIAVGALLIGQPDYIFNTITTISLIMIWYIWLPVVRSRHLIVDYYKFLSSIEEPVKDNICSEQEYVKNSILRSDANNKFGIKSNWRPTRLKIDLLLPVLYSAIWIFLIIHQHLTNQSS